MAQFPANTSKSSADSSQSMSAWHPVRLAHHDLEEKPVITEALGELRRRAVALAQAQQFTVEAELANRQILKFAPNDSSAIRRLARCLIVQRRIDEATEWLHRALAINPNDNIAK